MQGGERPGAMQGQTVDSDVPDVSLAAVGLPAHDFGGHPVRRALQAGERRACQGRSDVSKGIKPHCSKVACICTVACH